MQRDGDSRVRSLRGVDIYTNALVKGRREPCGHLAKELSHRGSSKYKDPEVGVFSRVGTQEGQGWLEPSEQG